MRMIQQKRHSCEGKEEKQQAAVGFAVFIFSSFQILQTS